MIESEIYSKALVVYGGKHQANICIEEMSELTKELIKFIRGENNVDHIAEEIADVIITTNQMMMLFDCRHLVFDWKAKKLERLTQRMKDIPVPVDDPVIQHVGSTPEIMGYDK